MLTEDYFMRMINQAIYVLRKLLGLKSAGRYQDALIEIGAMLEMLLGLRVDLIKRLDDDSLLDSLTQQGALDTERLYVVAELIREEGEILAAMERPEESYLSYLRALNFYVEVALNGGAEGFDPPHDKIEDLVKKLDAFQLPTDTLYPLFCYYEEEGQYGKGDETLARMAGDVEIRDEIKKEQAAYYERLLDIPEQALQKGGLPRDRVLEKLEALQT